MADHLMDLGQMPAARLWNRTAAAVLGLAVVCGANRAMAFPLVDPTGLSAPSLGPVPQGTDLAAPDAQDLRHQLQLVNGLGAPAGGGWTFVPRFDFQEMLTDNVLQQHSPRAADLVTYFAPGFSLAGNLPRTSLRLSYAPTLAIYARQSSLDAITQQLSGIGSIILMPDLLFVDVRALSGVQSAYGGAGGLGSVGASASGASTAQATIPTLAGNSQGLNRDNEVQSSSVGVSPYLMRDFGDWGIGRIGYSLDMTRSSRVSGFASSPFPTGGNGGQSMISSEEVAHYVTGDILGQFQNAVDADLSQSQITTQAGSFNGITGAVSPTRTHSTSTREIVTDKITWKVTRDIALFVTGGHEDIVYSGLNGQSIHDLTWSLGTTVTPNPDSQFTLSYGHQNGFNSISANGYYALGSRTLVNVAYGSTLGTQLENLRNQLNQSTATSNGTLVNAQNGGQAFASTNALPVQNGIFRTDSLTVGTQTTLDREIITLNLQLSKQTSTGGSTNSSSSGKSLTATWLHQMRPDMLLNAAVSYAIQEQVANNGLNPGNSRSLAASLGWQWQISDTISTSLRYSLFQRHAAVATYDIYQNMLILGVSKTF